MPHNALSLFSTLYLKNKWYDLNHSAYLGSVLVFEVLTSVFTWLLEVFDPNWPLLCPAAEPLPLMELCRRAARQALGRHRIHHIQSLPLPQTLKNYLQYQWETHTAKNITRSLKTHTERIVRAVEALCCAQTWIKCHRDGQIWPAGQVSGFIHDCEVTNEKVFVFGCEWLKFMSSMGIIFWRADDFAFSFTFI